MDFDKEIIDILKHIIPYDNNEELKKTLIRNLYQRVKVGKVEKDLWESYNNLRKPKSIENFDLVYDDLSSYLKKRKDKIGNILGKPISYDQLSIIQSDKGIFYVTRKYKKKPDRIEYSLHEILNSPIDILYKVIDINLGEIELYTYNLGDTRNRNEKLRDVLYKLEPKIQKNPKMGRDIMKKFFNHIGSLELMNIKKAEYIMGWDNGWNLPINENIKNMSIITHTALQELMYQRAKEMIYPYSPNKINDIKEKLKDFYESTKMDKKKQAIIIGWAMSSPFKLYFLDRFQLFPIIYLCGHKNTGKTYLALFYAIHFYRLLNSYLSESILNNKSQFEDYNACFSFPLFFSEFTEIAKNIIDITKGSCTGIDNMVRKTQNQMLRAMKPKIAPMVFDSNEIARGFDDSPLNTKMIFVNFEENEIIEENTQWVKLYNELTKEYLFSLIYNHTKDWDNEKIDEIINELKIKYKTEYEQLKKIDARLAKTYISIMFGIKLFEDVFDIELDKKDLHYLLIRGRTETSKELLEFFLSHCIELIHYADDKEDYEYNLQLSKESERPYHVPNPLYNYHSYIKHGLSFNRDRELIFTNLHCQEFNIRFKTRYKLKTLYGLLKDSIDDKSLIDYDSKNSKYSKDLKHTAKCFIIKERLISKRFKKKEQEIPHSIDKILGQKKIDDKTLQRIRDETIINFENNKTNFLPENNLIQGLCTELNLKENTIKKALNILIKTTEFDANKQGKIIYHPK